MEHKVHDWNASSEIEEDEYNEDDNDHPSETDAAAIVAAAAAATVTRASVFGVKVNYYKGTKKSEG